MKHIKTLGIRGVVLAIFFVGIVSAPQSVFAACSTCATSCERTCGIQANCVPQCGGGQSCNDLMQWDAAGCCCDYSGVSACYGPDSACNPPPGNTSTPTSVPPSPTGIIQGVKKMLPGNTLGEPAPGQQVYLNGANGTAANPFSFGIPLPAGGSNNMSIAQPPAGYAVGYTLCYDDISCHTVSPTPGRFATVSNNAIISNFGAGDPYRYADLHWHYAALTCNLDTNPPSSPYGVAQVTAGQSLTFTYTVTGAGPNGGGLYRSPAGIPVPTWTTLASGISANVSVPFLTPGTYRVVCNGTDIYANKCTGNPWCWGQEAGSINCLADNWNDCGTRDMMLVTVQPSIAPPTPTPFGTIQVYARQVPGPLACASIASSPQLAGVTFTLSPSANTTLLSSPEPYRWRASAGPVYSWGAPVVPTGYSAIDSCLTTNGGATYTQSSSVPLASGSTASFYVAYLSSAPWYQTRGGDVYGSGALKSLLPALAAVRAVSLDSDPTGSPGVFVHGSTSPAGTSYDFSPDTTGDVHGRYLIAAGSRPDWLVQDRYPSQNFYDYYWRKLGAPTATTPGYIVGTKPSSGCSPGPCVVFVDGPMSTVGSSWSVGSSEKIILLVNGTVDIQQEIHVASGGFIAIIARGNIAISPSVGTAGPTFGSTPHIAGIYVSNSSFVTGSSAEQLIARGMFIAQTMQFQRNLGSSNTQNPSELFIYGPEFLFSMPDILRDIPIKWEEVAP